MRGWRETSATFSPALSRLSPSDHSGWQGVFVHSGPIEGLRCGRNEAMRDGLRPLGGCFLLRSGMPGWLVSSSQRRYRCRAPSSPRAAGGSTTERQHLQEREVPSGIMEINCRKAEYQVATRADLA